MKKLSYLLWIMLFFCSCQDDKREQFMRLVQEWQGKEIRFPKEITFTRFVTDTVDYQIPTSDYKVLIYVDSIGCTSCKLQLPKWRKLIARVDSLTGGTVPFLFFFQSKDDKELRYILRRDQFDRPVCIDHKNELDRLNKFPANITFQTFLLDRDNKVVVIGNPIHNLAVEELYLKQLTGESQAMKLPFTTLQAEQVEYDLGTVKEGNIKEQVVTVRNVGNFPFHLKGFTTSCDCTEAACDWKTLAPGESGTITVRYKAEKPGDFFRTVEIYGNILGQFIQLRFVGETY